MTDPYNLANPSQTYNRSALDKFTEDRPLNRILKCACRFRANRVQNTDTPLLLFDCFARFDEIEGIGGCTAAR
jgi:5-methylcytosine-specific restriction endonuclease McrBC regulatory subunit McrC